MKQSCVQVYTGDGKGKTSAAVGLAVRAAGCGLSVKFVQFLKGRGTGEKTVLEKLENVAFVRVSENPRFFHEMNETEKRQMRSEAVQALRTVSGWLGSADVVVLDEALGALETGLITPEELLALIENRAGTELVLTGRNAPQWLRDKADLVTDMRAEKHYMDAGVAARRGIEY